MKNSGDAPGRISRTGFVDAPETDEGKFLVALPAEGLTALNMKNLIFLIHSRQYLINQSIGEKTFCIPDSLVEEMEGNESETMEAVKDSLLAYAEEMRGLGISEEKITFRFPYTEDAVKVKAWTDLATAMVKQAREQKRIDSEERIEENEKLIRELEEMLQKSSRAYNEKEKELMALQKMKLETENQNLRYVKTENRF